MDEAVDLSSSGTRPINNDCSVGFDIIIKVLRVMKTPEATGKVGEKGNEKRNRVDDPCVNTIVLTVPSLWANFGVARFAAPITRLFTPPRIGALTSSLT